jgi:hypothetical protein
MDASHNGNTAGRLKDRKGREYLDLGRFGTSMTIRVYFAQAARGQRRDESARIVLVGHAPELRIALDPYHARRLDRRQAVLQLWDRLVQMIDDKAAPAVAAATFEASMTTDGLAVPPGPLHRPGVPRRVRMILAYRDAHPAASHRMMLLSAGRFICLFMATMARVTPPMDTAQPHGSEEPTRGGRDGNERQAGPLQLTARADDL